MDIINLLDSEREQTDIALLLEALYAHHGYDFRLYSRESMTRRIHAFMAKYQLENVEDVSRRARSDSAFFNLLIAELSVTVTEMFRQPNVFSAFRDHVVSELLERPSLKVWVAGCATGEEAFSLAILLYEAGVLARTQIYATDINSLSIEKASKGIVPTRKLKTYTSNYHQFGGQYDFCDYFTVKEDFGFIDKSLRDRILFTSHNLVHDKAFGEMDIIFCRNVMIYFTPELQKKVLELFLESLRENGVLCIGNKESLYLSGVEHHFDVINKNERLYRRKSTQRGVHNVA
jgi:chemotaxis protein methyltransferase CheR